MNLFILSNNLYAIFTCVTVSAEMHSSFCAIHEKKVGLKAGKMRGNCLHLETLLVRGIMAGGRGPWPLVNSNHQFFLEILRFHRKTTDFGHSQSFRLELIPFI